MFNKILIANRGEVALRIMRAAKELGVKTVAVYSTEDADTYPVQYADEAVCIGPAQANKSYLIMANIIAAAKTTGAEAVHPGYGFLAENADFAQAVIDAGMVWVGPKPETIRVLGSKVAARRIAAEVVEFAREHGLPIAIKAVYGGGGRGLKVVHEPDEVAAAFESAMHEAEVAFGNGDCFVERFLARLWHVEVQVLGDQFGTVLAVGTRDCSLQRRNQKLIEEAPAPFLAAETVRELERAAVAICSRAHYESAGTVGFLVDDGTMSFMEVNTHIQVEHPVTEMVTGTDLVEEMIRVAAGDPLTFTQDDITYRGHAIECRVNAEQPERGFLPSPGTISQMHLPGGNGVRVDTAAYDGYEITPYYDSMIAKVIVHGRDRTEAIAKMRTALEEMVVVGVKTNLDFQYAIMENETFAAGHADTSFIERFMKGEV